MKKVLKNILSGLALLAVFSCSNPVDLVKEATEVVMAANSRYIEVVSLSPEPNEEIYASDVIVVNFDRSIDPDSIPGNIIVKYNGDPDGTNRVTSDWDIEYNNTLKRLTVDADPWLLSGKTVTVTIDNLAATDGSELMEKLEWSFSTNDKSAFNLTIDADYANGMNYTAIPVSLEFSSTADLYYYLTSSSVTSATAASLFNPSTWTQVTDASMTDSFSYSSQGESVPLYLWVYEKDGAGILSNNNTTETEYLLVDYTPPSGSFSLPSVVHSNIVTADMSGITDNVSGIAKYEFSNDSPSQVWTEDLTPDTTEGLAIRNNAGTRRVDCRVYDKAGNYSSIISAFTNYYMPVKVKLTQMTLSDADYRYLTEQWFWDFDLNGSNAFDRSSSTPFSQGVGFSGLTVTSVTPAYISKFLVDKNSAIPYTATTYVDVTTSGTVSISGYVGELDGKVTTTTDSGWFSYVTTNAQILTTTPTTKSFTPSNDTLGGISIGTEYWAYVEYAALNS